MGAQNGEPFCQTLTRGTEGFRHRTRLYSGSDILCIHADRQVFKHNFKHRCSRPSAGIAASGMASGTDRVWGMPLIRGDFTKKGSFIHKPPQGWLHPAETIKGPGASYVVRYMGCIEVLASMQSLDVNTRKGVTREAINRLCASIPEVKVTRPTKATDLQRVMGNSDLRFAGMIVTVNISVEGLSLLMPTTQQVIVHHPMQSISFASGGNVDAPCYVAYMGKDSVNQRACHILECGEGTALDVFHTIGQAFELQFKQYIKNLPKAICTQRDFAMEESEWGDGEDSSENDHCNIIPEEQPSVGAMVASSLKCAGAPLGHIHSQTYSMTGFPARKQESSCSQEKPFRHDWDAQRKWQSGLNPDGYLRVDGQPSRSHDDKEHLHFNIIHVREGLESGADGGQGRLCSKSPTEYLIGSRPVNKPKLPKAGDRCAPDQQGPSVPCPPAILLPIAEQLRSEAWYHGHISRHEAEKMLVQDGDFLVRDSTTNPGQYVLTGMHCGLPRHLLLMDPKGMVRTKDALFMSISDLVNYHLKNRLPIVTIESELYLQRMICRKW